MGGANLRPQNQYPSQTVPPGSASEYIKCILLAYTPAVDMTEGMWLGIFLPSDVVYEVINFCALVRVVREVASAR